MGGALCCIACLPCNLRGFTLSFGFVPRRWLAPLGRSTYVSSKGYSLFYQSLEFLPQRGTFLRAMGWRFMVPTIPFLSCRQSADYQRGVS
nr:hypothetical protein Iba_scaffold2431CG0570 [Ipomoea batatas]